MTKSPHPHFIIVRKPCPGYLVSKPRYLTMGCGWTTDIRKAMQFCSRESAEKTLRGRDGDILALEFTK